MTPAVDVLIETATYEGSWTFAASAEVPSDEQDPDFFAERAIFAARRLWNEAYTGVQGCQRRLTLTTYGPNYPDGDVLRSESRP